jgi:hypothetical protein
MCIVVPPFVSLLAWLTYVTHRLSGALEKSKLMSRAPSYVLTWTFFDPVHSSTTARTLCWL